MRTNVLCEMPVFSCNLLDQADVLLLVRLGIDELRNQYPDSTPSNVKAAYMSPWKSHLLTTKLNPLMELVAMKIKEETKRFLNVDLNDLKMDQESAPIVFSKKLAVKPAVGSLVSPPQACLTITCPKHTVKEPLLPSITSRFPRLLLSFFGLFQQNLTVVIG